MLTHTQIKTVLFSHGLFSDLPWEVIRRIQHSPTPDPDFLVGLSCAAQGNLNGCDIRLMSIDSEALTIDEKFLHEAKMTNIPILIRQRDKFFIYGDKHGNGHWEFLEINDKEGVLKQLPYDKKVLSSDDPLFSEVVRDTLKEGHAYLKGLIGILEEFKSGPKELMRLLTQAGDTVTLGGLQVEGKTILECAIAEGDSEMVEQIEPYFAKFLNGEQELERQKSRYRPLIAELPNQKPDEDLTWLFDLVIKCKKPEDILEELKTGDDYDWSYHSDLRNGFNQWRERKFDPKQRSVTSPRMHCNYQNIIHIYDLIYKNWNALTENGNGNNYDKLDLVCRQILGLEQLIGLPGYERRVYARGQIDDAINGKSIGRSLEYINQSGHFFPRFDKSLIGAHSGAGFNSYISIYGWGARGRRCCLGPDRFLQNLWSNKNFKLAELMQPHPRTKTTACVIL
jgi:hypothetical protein